MEAETLPGPGAGVAVRRVSRSRGPPTAGRAPRVFRFVLVLSTLLAPVALGAGWGSDEFEGQLAAEWTILRETPVDWNLQVCGGDGDPGGCYLTIVPREGSLEGASNDARNVFLQAAPEGDFRVTTLLAFFPEPGHRAGLLLYAGDDDFFAVGVANDGHGNVAETLVELGGRSTAQTVPYEWTPLWLRYERVGGRVEAYASADAVLWTRAGNATFPDAPLQSGLYAAKGHGAGAGNETEIVDASFGLFRVESPPVGETRTEPPTVAFVAVPGPEGSLEVAFRANLSWEYPGLRWRLDPGDGSPPVEGEGFPVDVVHRYAEAGDYWATLAARNVRGNVAFGDAAVSVEAAPPAEKAPANGAWTAEGDADGGAEAEAMSTAPAPSSAPVVLVRDATGASVDRAKGEVVVEVADATSGGVALVDVGPDGTERHLGVGRATWDTTAAANGPHRIEARDEDGNVVAVASVLVENPRASPPMAAAAVVAGAVLTAGLSVAVSALASRFDFMGYLVETAGNSVEDSVRARTTEVAALDRKLRVRSLVAAGVAVLLNALAFSVASVEPWDAVLFVASLPLFLGAAVAYGTLRFGGEYSVARRSGARTRFRIWVPGAVALVVSSVAFQSPFGYAGYIRKFEPVRPDPADRVRAVGLRALASLGVFLALVLPFLALGAWRYDVSEVAVGMAFAALGSAALPVRPLPGHALWRWNRALAALVAALGFTLYFLWQTALLPSVVAAGASAAGLVWCVVAVGLIRRVTWGADDEVVTDDG